MSAVAVARAPSPALPLSSPSQRDRSIGYARANPRWQNVSANLDRSDSNDAATKITIAAARTNDPSSSSGSSGGRRANNESFYTVDERDNRVAYDNNRRELDNEDEIDSVVTNAAANAVRESVGGFDERRTTTTTMQRNAIASDPRPSRDGSGSGTLTYYKDIEIYDDGGVQRRVKFNRKRTTIADNDDTIIDSENNSKSVQQQQKSPQKVYEESLNFEREWGDGGREYDTNDGRAQTVDNKFMSFIRSVNDSRIIYPAAVLVISTLVIILVMFQKNVGAFVKCFIIILYLALLCLTIYMFKNRIN